MMSPPTHIHTDPQIPPLSLSPADVPPLFTGLPQRALRENPPLAASGQDILLAPEDNPRALREDSLAALRSRVSWGLGSGQSLGLSAVREEGPDEVEGYQGVTVLPGRAGEHIYMAVLRKLRVTNGPSESQHASSCMLTIIHSNVYNIASSHICHSHPLSRHLRKFLGFHPACLATRRI